MNRSESSYGRIIKSTSIIGGASILNVLMGILRMKVAAIILGPSGVGLIGLFLNIVTTSSQVVGMGFASVGVRNLSVALEQDNQASASAIKKTLFWGPLILSSALFSAVYIFKDFLTQAVFNNSIGTTEIVWLSLGVGLSALAASQTAILNGMHLIRGLAKTAIISSLVSTLLGTATLFLFGEEGSIAFVLVAPISNFIVVSVYLRMLPKLENYSYGFNNFAENFFPLIRLGFLFMLAGLAGPLGQLIVRLMIENQIGSAGLGYYQAASNISMTYIGFILAAMTADYYPRLAAVIENHNLVNKLVNEQADVALILSSPIFIFMMGATPWVIALMYSDQFLESTLLLRWQIVGDLFKILSWPLGIIILATGSGKILIAVEFIALCIYVGGSYFLLDPLGIVGSGIAFFLMYLVFLGMTYIYAIRKTKFSWNRSVKQKFIILMATISAVFFVSEYYPMIGLLISIVAAILFAGHGMVTLTNNIDSNIKKFQIIRVILKKFFY